MLTAAFFLLCYAAGCLLSIARHPIYGLVTYVGVFYLNPVSRWWGEVLPDLRWSFTAAGFTLLGLLLRRRKFGDIPLFRHRVMLGMLAFIAWIAIQSPWALDPEMHQELLTYYVKFAIAIALIYRCIENETHLKMFLWSHMLGCFYFGWIAFERYTGGRFEGFGGHSFGDANFAGVQIVTGIFVGASLLLGGTFRERIGVLGCAPFIVNALITTISRSAFLALCTAGVAFNFFAASRIRMRVSVFSVVGLVLFLGLASPQYWDRISTILFAGEVVEGVDTGASRLVTLRAQIQMFGRNPMGCGHRCTVLLSSDYMDDRYLTGPPGNRGRASHNTFMTMMVEHGIPGGVFYGLFVLWVARSLLRLKRELKGREGFLPAALPAVGSVLVAITVADLFVDYLKLEVRLWFLALLMVMVKLAARAEVPVASTAELEPTATVTARGRS